MARASPDGSQVAFSWTGPRQDNEDIYVKLVGPGEPLQLTTNPARDSSPAWSPDGRSIAFLRWSRQNDSDVDIMLVPALGNAAERRVASVINKHPISRPLSKLAWTADSQWLAIAAAMSPEEQQGLWLLSLDGQQRRRLPEAPERQGGAIVFNPAFSSDGRRLAYIRLTSANVASIYVLAFSADMMPDGAPVSVTDASQGSDIVALAWTENDSALVFSMSNQSAQSRLHRLKLTPDRLHRAGAAQALPFGDLAINLTASRAGRLVYRRTRATVLCGGST